jgi:hypothetical protein
MSIYDSGAPYSEDDILAAAEENERQSEHLCDFHTLGDGSWAEYDGYGIYLTRVCEKCEREKMAKFRQDIRTAYDTDDQIEADY